MATEAATQLGASNGSGPGSQISTSSLQQHVTLDESENEVEVRSIEMTTEQQQEMRPSVVMKNEVDVDDFDVDSLDLPPKIEMSNNDLNDDHDTAPNDSAVTPTTTPSSASALRSFCAPVTGCWRAFTDVLRTSVSYFVIVVARHAASHPVKYLVGVLLLTFLVAGVGVLTNLTMNVQGREMITVDGSVTKEQYDFVFNKAGFPHPPQSLRIMIHREGDNVVTKDGIFRAFEVVDAVQETEGYTEICQLAEETNTAGHGGLCHIRGVPMFWNLSRDDAEQQLLSEVDVKLGVSQTTLPDESTVDPREFMGNIQYFNNTLFKAINTAESFLMEVRIPSHVGDDAHEMAKTLLDRMLDLRQHWKGQGTSFQLEVYLTDYSYEAETIRAIFKDLPLIPLVFVVMTLFTIAVFSASHKEGKRYRQRFMLGFGAVATILLSMITSFGFMFITGVPFSSTTQVLPFIMFGIGLDDAFIIFGEFARTDEEKDLVDRVHDTFQEVGLSTFLTTLTTSLAFALGATTAVPELQWLAFYAFPTVVVDWLYQISFFVAIIVIDERRIAASVIREQQEGYQKTWCCGLLPWRRRRRSSVSLNQQVGVNNDEALHRTAPFDAEVSSRGDHSVEESESQIQYNTTDDISTDNSGVDNSNSSGKDPVVKTLKFDPLAKGSQHSQRSFHRRQSIAGSPMDRAMIRYADFLLRKPTKIFILVAAVVGTGLLVWSATLFNQQFNIYDVLTRDSYTAWYFRNVERYADRGFVVPIAYFRNVDQSDPDVQQQMEDFIDDLVEIDSITSQPPFFWLRMFKEFLTFDKRLTELSFNQQLDIFLSIDAFRLLYGDHIVRDPETGDIIVSRCVMYMDNIDMGSVKSQTNAWKDLLAVTAAQPINSEVNIDKGEGYHFFLFEETVLYSWEFYIAMTGEMVNTGFLGVIGVGIVSSMFLPHWSAPAILIPLLSILFVDMIGFLQACGANLDIISCFTLIVSIGLLVDFNMHILMKYYESPCDTRESKVKDSLQTMGSSVMIGGLSTMLGVVPLIFTSGSLMKTLFYGFWGMCILGITHGLMLLPVLLSMFGPLNVEPPTTFVMGKKNSDASESLMMEVERPPLKSATGSFCNSVPTTTTDTTEQRQGSASDNDVPPERQISPLRRTYPGGLAGGDSSIESTPEGAILNEIDVDELARRTWSSPAALNAVSGDSAETCRSKFFDEGSSTPRPSSFTFRNRPSQ